MNEDQLRTIVVAILMSNQKELSPHGVISTSKKWAEAAQAVINTSRQKGNELKARR